MNHLGTKNLETERLILRQLTIDDVYDYYSYVWSEKDPFEWKPEEQAAAMEKRIKRYSWPDYYHWAIAEKSNNKVIGEILIVNNNEKMLSCEIAYGMSLKHRNNGFTSEALRYVLRFLLIDIGYNRIQAGHLADNPASGRVMEKAGMTCEGTLRQDNRNSDGVLTDSKIYGMLKSDLANSILKD